MSELDEQINFIKYYMKEYFYEDISIEDDFKFEEAILKVLKELENSISKDKIKEKIKTYKDMCARLGLSIDKETFNMFNNKIEILQELLGDEE